MHALAPALLTLGLAAATVAQDPTVPSPSPGASASPREITMDRLQWSKDVDGAAPVTAVEVRNDFGDIRARGADDRRLDATMVVQRLDLAGEKLGFTVERRGGVVALVVSYPPGRVRDADPHPAKDSYDRLDLVVFIPKGVTLRAQTLRGRVEVRGLKSDVEASTLDGPIFVRTTGAVQARTDSGEVTVLLDAAAVGAPGSPMVLQSETGPIGLVLPRQGDPELHVATTGEVVSKLRLNRAVRAGRTQATLGTTGPGRLVVVSSRSGRVTVEREEPALFAPPAPPK